MPAAPTLQRVDLLKMAPDQRSALLEDWARVNREHFPDVRPELLGQRYAHDDLLASRLGCLRDAEGNLVGVQAVVSCPVEVDGHRYTVIRSGVVKSGALGRTPRAFDRFGPGELIRQALAAHLRRSRPWVIATSESPVTYHRIARFFPTILPSPDVSVTHAPARVELLRALARGAGFALLEDRPFCAPGSGLKVTDEERVRWAKRTDPTVQRYLKECPDYGEGPALLFGVELTLATLAGIPVRMVRGRV